MSRGAGDEIVPALPQPTDDPASTRQRAATLIQQAAPQTTAMELALRAELPERQRRRADADRDAEHAPVRPRRVLGRLAAARRAHRHGQLSDGAPRQPARGTADARGRDRRRRPPRRHRRAQLVGRQRARSGSAAEFCGSRHRSRRCRIRSAKTTTCCGSPTNGISRPAPPMGAERVVDATIAPSSF